LSRFGGDVAMAPVGVRSEDGVVQPFSEINVTSSRAHAQYGGASESTPIRVGDLVCHSSVLSLTSLMHCVRTLERPLMTSRKRSRSHLLRRLSWGHRYPLLHRKRPRPCLLLMLPPPPLLSLHKRLTLSTSRIYLE
jgi:hypothetical protein